VPASAWIARPTARPASTTRTASGSGLGRRVLGPMRAAPSAVEILMNSLRRRVGAFASPRSAYAVVCTSRMVASGASAAARSRLCWRSCGSASPAASFGAGGRLRPYVGRVGECSNAHWASDWASNGINEEGLLVVY
jgi:hypothetical protein